MNWKRQFKKKNESSREKLQKIMKMRIKSESIEKSMKKSEMNLKENKKRSTATKIKSIISKTS